MYGTITGNIIGTLYFLAFQVCGILIALRFIKSERLTFRILIGSVIGSVGLHWCPVLFSFLFDFTQTSHICGLVFFVFITVLALWLSTPVSNGGGRGHKKDYNSSKNKNAAGDAVKIKDSILNYPFLIVGIPLFIFFCMLLWNHTIVEYPDGSIYTGQCTFGDMNMHLGFITSIAKQQTFPPYYSILPDTKLAYPFLSDAISSSVYIWGATLRYAYMLPMWFAILQVMFGMYTFAESWLKSRWKAFLAFVLFFFNGGFGIVYFLNGSYTFDDLMNGFYNTPTNLVDVNVKWTNTIVDMLLPQRATLFGWALLFPALCLVHKAWTENKRRYFIIAAFVAGALPMIHTHSFLALGIICFGWLIADMARRSGVLMWSDDDNSQRTGRLFKITLGAVVVIGLTLFSVLQILNIGDEDGGKMFVSMAVSVVALLVLFLIYCWYRSSKDTRSIILKSWGIFLVIVLVLAMPQLFYWTFRQVSGGGMLRGHFNWSNDGEVSDAYILFYLKNIGLVAVLFVVSWIFGKKRDIARVMPALIIWYICELVVFQPNNYDNNKLLLAAYMLICCFVAGNVCDWLNVLGRKISKIKQSTTVEYTAKGIITSALVFVCTISAVLTMAREYNSGREGHSYQLYDKGVLDACRFIEDNTQADDVILTANNHNNAVSSLTGRNIVCGTSSFLYYHGLDYYERESNLTNMYCNPKEYADLFRQYDVDYILVSSNEYGTFENIDENAIYEMFTCVYSTDSVRMYKVKS